MTLGATTDSIIRTIVTRNRGLEQLSIYCSSKFSSKGVKVIAENCPILKALKLKCSVRMSDKSIEPILKYCTALEELSLFSCSKVKGTVPTYYLMVYVCGMFFLIFFFSLAVQVLCSRNTQARRQRREAHSACAIWICRIASCLKPDSRRL